MPSSAERVTSRSESLGSWSHTTWRCSGPLRGSTAEVEDITTGQGGWDVVWLDLGPERRKKFSNIFEEYSLLKIQKGEHP